MLIDVWSTFQGCASHECSLHQLDKFQFIVCFFDLIMRGCLNTWPVVWYLIRLVFKLLIDYSRAAQTNNCKEKEGEAKELLHDGECLTEVSCKGASWKVSEGLGCKGKSCWSRNFGHLWSSFVFLWLPLSLSSPTFLCNDDQFSRNPILKQLVMEKATWRSAVFNRNLTNRKETP